MKFLFSIALLLAASLAFAETTGVQAVPSDEIRYPDASQIVNKAEPQAKPVSVNKLVATKPAPAQTVATAVPNASAPKGAAGWYLKWSLADEAQARSWAASLGIPAEVAADGAQWQVVAGPLNAEGLKLLSAQTGKAVLIRK